MKQPVRVAVTGAAGAISYTILFKIAAGELLGKDQPVILQLVEIPPAMTALNGVVMELIDCAFPLVAGITTHDNPEAGFQDADVVFLIGARPRGPGMERADLLKENAKIFSVQGKALNDHASKDVRVLVVGNPANTNALIASRNAPDLDPRQFTADDAIGPQSCSWHFGQSLIGAADRCRSCLYLGESLANPVPGSASSNGKRSAGVGSDRSCLV